MIDRLARNARRRTELRRCLRQHIEGLRKAVDTDPTIEVEQKLQLTKSIDKMQKSLTARLDDVEEVVRDLLQIVRISRTGLHLPELTTMHRSSLGFRSMKQEALSVSAGLLSV